ncbi:His Kinase A (phospho-acceptor) domain-containing protein [Noviherbaspirillum humi]|uniref:histidine kinase n=2 Tax=Noviherbaspirillum humi TaxID=1688639 RepID=A0A239M5B6_9BURK|nr:His Kinase A (phospho-acceptor) domain-containing protein [Noviherbaspirillum humi]
MSFVERRVLVYTPTGKDGMLIAKLLERADIERQVCRAASEVIEELERGAGCILIADDALTKEFMKAVTPLLKEQPTWSDLPILVLSKRGLNSSEMRSIYLELGNVTLLERPVQGVTLVMAVISALRGRSRQYEMREIDRRKDEFLAMLAHELRNPLAPIGAASDLLRVAQFDPIRIQQTSEIIARQVKHMTSLIDDLLDASRVSRGLVKLERSQVDARQLVSSAVEQARPLIDARRHRLTVRTPPEAAMIHGDQKRLIQVISNLLNNASKYSPEGSNIMLSLDVELDKVIISVADDGIGMAQATIDHVFEMFTQAERTSDRSQGGLGIGLALVKSLVEQHDGTVSASSPGIGKGSQFAVHLPRLTKPQAHDVPDKLVSAAAAVTGLRMLVVDDNVDAAHMLSLLLDAMGHETMVEHTAKSALERARKEMPEVCLLDIGLPDLDGNDLAKQLRAQPETAHSILVAITGYGQEQDRKKTAESGFDHHLVKPVNMEDLLRVMSELP